MKNQRESKFFIKIESGIDFHTCARGGAGPGEDWARWLGEGPPNSIVLSKFSKVGAGCLGGGGGGRTGALKIIFYY